MPAATLFFAAHTPTAETMAYHVLARKWRPRSFATMVGQQHVLRALINALDHQRLHHAYLFTGTRGVGKTTIARIFAKSLNCERGVSSTPCGECASCREIDEGRFVDLIEVDAASRTGVDDTRELLENVQYTPSRGRYKVYLIDEVHMFSKSSFNALLKTLEEPPPHVKFLLATTDPQKLPATVLSRCLQFNLKRLPLELIRDHLGNVLTQEEVPFQAGALVSLARAADGSMRDGLSLLDQAIAYGGGHVDEEDVRAMLGSIGQDHAFGLLEALAAGDAERVLKKIDDLAQRAPDYGAWLAETITLLQRIALAQQVPDAIDDALGDRQRVLALATAMEAEDVQLYYQIGLIGRRDLPLSPEPRSGFEMVLLRMLAFRPTTAPATPVAASTAAPRVGVVGQGGQTAAHPGPALTQPPPPREPAPPKTPTAKQSGGTPRGGGRFDQMRSLLGNKGRPAGKPSVSRTSSGPGAEGLRPPPPPTAPLPAEQTPGPSAAQTPPVDVVEPPIGFETGPDLVGGYDSGGDPRNSPPLPDLDSAYDPGPGPDLYSDPGPPAPYTNQAVTPTMSKTVQAESHGMKPAREPNPAPAVVAAAKVAVQITDRAPAEETKPGAVTREVSLTVQANTDQPLDWLASMPTLGLSGMTRQLASHCAPRHYDGATLVLVLAPDKAGLLGKERKEKLQQALRTALGPDLRLRIETGTPPGDTPAMVEARNVEARLQAARRAIDNDPMVNTLKQRFGARVHADSVRPLARHTP